MHHGRGIVVVAAVLLAAFGVVGNVSAASASLRITPATQTVAGGATFTVKVVMNSSVPSVGAQASVTFDRTKVQVTAVAWGAAFSNAPVLVPSDPSGAIPQANSTGKLSKLAAAYVLPQDAVPPGDADVLSVTFKATGCGNVALGLPVGPSDGALLDGRESTIGDALGVTASGGSLTIDCGGTAPTAAATSSSATASSRASAASRPSAEASSAETAPPEATSAAVEGETAAASPTGVAAAQAPGSSSGPGGGLPLWLPVVLSVPAIAIVVLGLMRWRRLATV